MPTYGPNSGSTAVSEAYTGSSSSWSSPSNALTDGSDYALTSTSSGSPNTEYLKFTGFGFTIGAGETIDGVVVEYKMYEPGAKDGRVRLVKAGTVQSGDRAGAAAYSSGFPPGTYFSRGGVSDLWDGTWADTDVEDSGFGFAVAATWVSGGGNPCCFHGRITVYTSAGAAGGQPAIARMSGVPGARLGGSSFGRGW